MRFAAEPLVHGAMSEMSRTLADYLLVLLLLPFLSSDVQARTSPIANSFPKCCPERLILSDDLKCTPSELVNRTVFDVLDLRNKADLVYTTYFESGEGGSRDSTNNISAILEDPDDRCVDIFANTTLVVLKIEKAEVAKSCDSPLTALKFWGATIVVFANLVYIVPYILVVLIYYAIPDLRHRAYDGAVIGYNVTQIVLNSLLIGLGWSILCHRNIPEGVYVAIGLSLLYLTLVSTLWLFVICFDMTLVITRFRWAPSSNLNRQQEKKKFLVYSIIGWGVALIPTGLVALLELTPWVPKSSPFKPNFGRFDDGPNLAVIVYVAALPALICMINSALFFYTTYRMIVMKKSTTVATQSITKRAKKKYYVFLRLYLLMDAPWITAALGAIFSDLWVLKFLRMIQPILMLMAIVPRKTLVRAFEQWFSCAKQKHINNETRQLQTAQANTVNR